MKKKFFAYILPLVILAGFTLALTPQQDKGNQGKGNNKEKQVAPGKSANAGDQKPDKDNKGKSDNEIQPGKGKGNDNKNDQGNKNDNSPGNSGDAKNKGNVDKDMTEYKWNKENFKDRKKYKNQNKVTICHKVSGDNPVTISVSENALQAHLNHGDTQGDCTYQNDRYSKTFWNKRENYYDWMERTRDQVSYSRSILDYARQRLTDSRSNLVVLRNSNASPDVIVVREAQVAELDNNVTVLETLLQTAVGLLVN